MLKGNKRYTIEITEVAQEETLTEQEWTIIEEVEAVKKWDYTPQIKTIKEVQRQILKQNVSELNLINVIKAINGID